MTAPKEKAKPVEVKLCYPCPWCGQDGEVENTVSGVVYCRCKSEGCYGSTVRYKMPRKQGRIAYIEDA